MNLKNDNSIPKHKEYFKETISNDMNYKYFQRHSSKNTTYQNNISDSNETSSSTGRCMKKPNLFNINKSKEILKKIKINKFAKYFGEKKIQIQKKVKKKIYFSESKKLKFINSDKNILISDNYNINIPKEELDNYSIKYNSNSKYKNTKLYHKKILKNNINENLKNPKSNKINLNSIKINNIQNYKPNSAAKVHFFKNKSNYFNNKKMRDVNDYISENDINDNLGINSATSNDYKINKPKEMNIKYNFFKNYLNDEEEQGIINISHISKKFIGEINEYKDIIEDDKKFSFRDSRYDSIHQKSKILYSKNLVEDLDKICNILDNELLDEKEENVDEDLINKPNYHISRNSQKYFKQISNTIENSNIRRTNRVYSRKKIIPKSKVINKNKKMPLSQKACHQYLIDSDEKEKNIPTEKNI